jgi:hypothetical protein
VAGVHTRTTWEPDELVEQPGGLEANEQMQRLQIEVMGHELRLWMERGREHGREWAVAAGLSDYVLRLTPDETRQVLEEVHAVLDRWAEAHQEPRTGTLPVNLFLAAFPRTEQA